MKFRRLRRLFRPALASWPLTKPPPIPADQLTGPPLSVIVICYQMDRQLKNTLLSLIPPYQSQEGLGSYDVHVIDNGSERPLGREFWQLAPNIHYQYVSPALARGNPGVAINRAVAATRSPVVCIMIDGARMLSPGVLKWGMELASLSPRTIAEVRGWHLGPKLQIHSISEGYDSAAEQKLLEQIGWPSNGYRLFEVSVPAASMPEGFLGRAGESTCLFMSRELFDGIGGYDERYQEPGGGLVNVDFFWRAVAAADRVFTVLGEGTFHQVHGGAATGVAAKDLREKLSLWRDEYERLSRPWRSSPDYQPVLAGHLPKECRAWLTPNPI